MLLITLSVEVVKKFLLLGSILPDTTDDVKRRIAMASTAFDRLRKNIWCRRDLPNAIKLRLFNSLIVLIVTYASETLTSKSKDIAD